MSLSSFIRLFTLVAFIIMAALSRILPHPPNFTPIVALALFGSTYFSQRYVGLFVALAAMLVSDLILGLHTGMWFVYGTIVLISFLSIQLRNNVSILKVTLTSLAGSVLFYLITNFGVWLNGGFYPKNLSGLVLCYTAGIPFFGNSIVGDLFYCTVLFGLFELAKKKIPALAVA
jgi:hypothetical protein